jgi:small basic protein (TIGR04137 family)
MSLHQSLQLGRRTSGHRNVLSREERIIKLEEDGRWDESSSSVFGLPKVRSIKAASGKKAKKKDDDATAEAGAEGAADAAPAAGAK